MNLIVWAVLGYVLFQIALGFFFVKRIKTEDDYLLAGRRLSPALVVFSVFATWFGAETCIGTVGRVYSEGLSGASTDPFGYAICILLMGVLLAVPLWKLKLTTLADLFRLRYGLGVERLATLILIPGSLLWAAAQVRGFGQVLSASSALSPEAAITIAALAVIIYTTVGGMLADAWSDLIQGCILILGLTLTAALVFARGGWPEWDSVPVEKLSWRHPEAGWLDVLELWAVPVLGSLPAQELAARVMAARSARTAQQGTITASILYVSVGMIPLMLGFAAISLLPADTHPEQAMATLVQQYLPTGLYVIFIGALVSAILSTVDTTLLVCGSLTAHNLVLPVWPKATQKQRVRINRFFVIIFGVIAYLLAVSSESIFGLIEEASSLGTAGILMLVLFGIFGRGWGGRPAAYATLVAGLVVYVSAQHVYAYDYPFLLSLAAALLAYLLFAPLAMRRTSAVTTA